MALTRTTLTAAIKATDVLIPVASTATGFPAVATFVNPQPALYIDDELMYVVQVPVANSVQVRMRGSEGQAAAHDVGAPVVLVGNAFDLPNPLPGGFFTLRPATWPDQIEYGQNGAIAVPTVPLTNAFLTKATAAAMTLGAPSLALDGLILKITSQTPAAHVITATGLLNNGAAGSPFNSVTFPAQPGAAIELVAVNGLWHVNNTNGAMTFA